jgi:hypothetical protein
MGAIFDDERIRILREKYSDQPDYLVPPIALLDRHEEFSGERPYLEELALAIPEAKRRRLITNFLSEDAGQHLASWFELMLLGWLQECRLGPVEYEPSVEGNEPDFAVQLDSGSVYIEAKVLTEEQAEQDRLRVRKSIDYALSRVERAYVVYVDIEAFGTSIDETRLQREVTEWLDTEPAHDMVYQDELGNVITLEAKQHDTAQETLVRYTAETRSISPLPLRSPLKQKAKQHKGIRRASLPYVIALFLESSWLSAEEVQEAWFGRQTLYVDRESGEVVDEGLDGTGLHYAGGSVLHKSISGTLVFRPGWDLDERRRFLRCWYIQNPYATVSVDRWLFPAESRLIEIGRSATGIEMSWVAGGAE